MKKPALPVFALAFALAGIPLAGECSGSDRSGDRQKLVSLYSDARAKFLSNDYSQAVELFKEYVALLPRREGSVDVRRARVEYNLAACHIALGNTDEAFRHLGRAVEHGIWNLELLRRDPTLEPLRRRKKFSALIEKAKNGVAGLAFGLKDLDGNVLRRKDFDGKVVILDVWGTWCPPCRMEIPHFVDLQGKYRGQGLRIIGVTYEKTRPTARVRERVKQFANVMDINYPLILADRELISAIPDLRGYPTTFLIDRNGVVRRRFFGYQTYGTLERAARKLLDEKKKAEKKKAEKK